jgi:NAD(P)-dependent dehydrogenase (short-subunit alcohol dehydrogenase family)
VTDPGWNGRALGLGDRRAVVIGASEGIGAAIALGLSRAGAEVVLAGRSAERLKVTAETVRTTGQQAHVHTVDARDPDQIRAFCAAVLREHGAPSILVNSMGGTLFKPAIDVEPEEWDAIHETHLRGTFFFCTSFAAAMADEGYGKIVNLSSTFATAVVTGRSVYATAKAGISQLTAALALEWAPFGIRVNAVAPGATRSPRVERWLVDNPGLEERMVQGIPLGRIARPDDIVGPALFLASPMSDFVTGQTLLVDGGWAKSQQQAPIATPGATGPVQRR